MRPEPAGPAPAIREITPAEAERLIAAGAALLDTREPHEWQSGHLAGATLLPPATIAERVGELVADRQRPVVIYCAHGSRSLYAAMLLGRLGYRDIASVAGGIVAWRAEGRPVEMPAAAPGAPNPRYARQLVMPEIGPAGQARLTQAKVLVVGAGGLGSPALLYLAAAGAGHIGIVDFDVVELSNLQRQIAHADDRIGSAKTASAAQAIQALNPEVNVRTHDGMLTEANAAALIAGHDVVIDGSDNFETRYALNDAAVRAGIPVVHASVYRFEGQLTVLAPGRGPCYRCLYPLPPPPELAPACSVAGVLGVVPGVLGLLQAAEAIKLIVGIGEPLIGRLLTWDALDGTFSEIAITRDPACPACAEPPAIN